MSDTGIADFDRCKGGQKEHCCAYLTMGVGGFECARATSLEATIRVRVLDPGWTAKRLPTRPYPACQDEPLEVDGDIGGTASNDVDREG